MIIQKINITCLIPTPFNLIANRQQYDTYQHVHYKKIKNIEHNTNATTLECCREEKNHSYNKPTTRALINKHMPQSTFLLCTHD